MGGRGTYYDVGWVEKFYVILIAISLVLAVVVVF